MLPCATKMHFVNKTYQTLYTNNALPIIKQCELYSKQFPPKVFFLVLTLRKTLVLTSPTHIYGQTNCLKRPTINIFYFLL